MAALQIEFQPAPRGIVVLVVDRSDEIRGALAVVLEDAGYAVIEAQDLIEAGAIIDAAPAPMMLITASVGMGNQDGVGCFTAVAASSSSHRAYIYVSSLSERRRLPALVYGLGQVGVRASRKSYELVSVLAVVATAAARVRIG